MPYTPETILWAALGGFLPAILWLFFWLREDSRDPEPSWLIIGTFLGGMIAVPAAYALELAVNAYVASGSLPALASWAVIEETLKFSIAAIVAFRSRWNDEPVDPMMYLITAALGFAALENALFLLHPFQDGSITQGLITGNLRFIGSTLLHTVCSGSIGILMAYGYCEMRARKWAIAGAGLILASLLHTLFNFFILKGDNNLFTIFAVVWVGVVLLILFAERVKAIDRTCIITT